MTKIKYNVIYKNLPKGGDGVAIEMKSPKPCPGFW